MKLFRIKYLLSGKYNSSLIASILFWENGHVKLRDQNGRIHDLSEANILKITKMTSRTIKPTTRRSSIPEAKLEDQTVAQGTLF